MEEIAIVCFNHLYRCHGCFFTHRTSSQKSDEKSILTVWEWDETIPNAFREYQLSHPQVSMNYVHVEKNEYLDKLKLSLALQQPLPDICILENENAGSFYSC